jgi:MFS family permease
MKLDLRLGAGEQRTPVFKPTYKRYVVSTLTLTYTFSQVDQGLISVLLQPIQTDLHLSDTQLGFVTGIAFGLFYATLGLPAARWADRSNRSTITALAIGLWGATVMSCLFVTNFVQLVFSRMAAAAGASACMPPTYSLVGDYFPKTAEHTRAMTIYTLASPLSGLVGYVLGGWLNERFGWRAAFVVAGIPGLVLAALVKLTVAETRVHKNPAQAQELRKPSMRKVLSTLWHQQSSRHLGIAIILIFTMGWGLNPWYAAFMVRSHLMGTVELGMWLGVIFGFSGVAGVLLGGYMAERWFSDDERGQMRLTAVITVSLVPLLALFLLLPQKHQSLTALGLSVIVSNFFFGPAFALMQRLVVAEMRATQLAIVMLLANLIGMGVGSQVVGILSDLMKPLLGNDSLRYAMIAVSLVALWSAYHFWHVGRTIKDDLREVVHSTPSSANRGGIEKIGLTTALELNPKQ